MAEEDVVLDEYFKRVYALVIGISRYENSYEPNQTPDPDGFRRLSYAEKDAVDFTDYLLSKGVIPDSIYSLINEKATLKGIKKAFKYIRIACAETRDNPLVIVFFSGHGEADGVEHYLVPYEASRVDIDVTGFSNKEFNEELSSIETDKLVVFLDACYSGGVAETSGKGDFAYDPGVLGVSSSSGSLGAGKGRYVFASCAKGELSYEGDHNNGIFTQHLLELLNCEGNDVIQDEEINTDNLFEKLSYKVSTTARQLRQQKQTPTRKIEGGQQPIKLGINIKLKRARLEKEKRQQENRIIYGQHIVQKIMDQKDLASKEVFKNKLERYIETNTSNKKYEELFLIYETYFGIWCNREDKTDVESEACDDLIDLFRKTFYPEATGKNILPVQQASPTPIQRSAGVANQMFSRINEDSVDTSINFRPSDGIMQGVTTIPDNYTVADKGIKPTDNIKTPEKLSASEVEEVRNLSGFANEILEAIYSPQFLKDPKVRELVALLDQPSITRSVFSTLVQELRKLRADNAGLITSLDQIEIKFDEYWVKAPTVETKTAVDILYKR